MTIKVSSFFMNKHDFTHIQQDNMVLWAEETEMRHNMNHINHLIKYIYRPDIQWWFIKNEGTKHFNTYKVLTIIERRKNIYIYSDEKKWKADLLAQQFFQCNHLNQNQFISFSHRDSCLSNRSRRILEQHDITFWINRFILDKQWIHHDPTCSRIIRREVHPIIG